MSYKPLFLFDEGDQGIPIKEKPSKRKVPKTSIDANHSVADMKEAHYLKIVEALTLIKVGATYEQLASHCQLDKAQVNRRLSEMVRNGIVYNVGTTRPTISGRQAMIRQLTSLK